MTDLGAENDGLEIFKLGDKEVELDLYQVCKKISDIKQRHEQFSEGFWLDDVVELMVSLGFSKPSTSTGLKFVKAISTKAEELKKNIE